MNRFVLLALSALTLALVACSGDDTTSTTAPEPEPEPAAAADPAADGSTAEGEDGEAAADPRLDPGAATETAPDSYTVKFETTKGDMLIDVTRAWAPKGADRFYNLVQIGYYDDVAFFRVIDGFMAQLGIHGDPAIAKVWKEAQIADDPVKESNTAGMVTFATAGPNTRTTQIFLNFGDNSNLDGMGFAPFGKLQSMDVLNQINHEYGEGAPRGRGPHQGRMQVHGNAYLKKDFPNLDYIVKATIVE